jgi:hypothetical protein
MNTDFTKIEFDLYCEWKTNPPAYRVYVNDEMFTERTYIWQGGQYLTELLQLSAPAGQYKVRVENLGSGSFKMRNMRCTVGNASVIDNETFEVLAA